MADERTDLNIVGMNCASCAAHLEAALHKIEGVKSASVNIATEKAHIEFDPARASLETITKTIETLGFSVADMADMERKRKGQKTQQEQRIEKLKRRFLYSALLGAPLLYLAMGEMLGLPLPTLSLPTNIIIQMFLSTAIMALNYELYISGLKKLVQRNPNMDSLVEIGTIAAYLYSVTMALFLWYNPNAESSHIYFESAGIILVFISMGKFLEEKTKGKAGEAIKKLLGLQAKTARVERDGSLREVPISSVQYGDIVVVKAGESVPVDGIILSDVATLDESAITGESLPVVKKGGETIIGGAINKTHLIRLEARKIGSETMLAGIIKIVEAAIASKAPVQFLADKVSFYFVPIVLGISLATFSFWLLLGMGFPFALTTMVSVLIIACPCALGLAVPTAVMVGSGIAAQNGILIKTSRALETARQIDTVLFDKTGTLTKGQPIIASIVAIDANAQWEKILGIATGLALSSLHPFSLAIVAHAQKKGIDALPITQSEESEGKGIKGSCPSSGAVAFLGNETLLLEAGISIPPAAREAAKVLAKQGESPLYVAAAGSVLGILGVTDEIRQGAPETIAALHKMGKKTAMLSGDRAEIALALAKKLGIETVYAGVLPAGKSVKIKELQQQGAKVAFVGDGINDAPALAQADLGIALAAGADIAMEAGEIVLIKNNIEDVALAMRISEFTLKKIRQNLFWAFCYNSAGIPLAAGVLYPLWGILLNPMVAAIAMSFSSVSVITNSLLMKRKRFSNDFQSIGKGEK